MSAPRIRRLSPCAWLWTRSGRSRSCNPTVHPARFGRTSTEGIRDRNLSVIKSNRPDGQANGESGDARNFSRREVLMSATALSAFGPSLLAAEANAQATALPYHSLGVAAAAAAIRRGEISAEA